MARRRRKRPRRSSGTRVRSPKPSSFDSFDRRGEAVLELVEYEITPEPLDGPDFDGLSSEDLERIDDVVEAFRLCPREQVEELEWLVAEFPDISKLRNYLSVAYNDAERPDDAERVVRETYERFPDYLFGVLNYAYLAIHEGRPEDVPGILGDRFALHQLCPGRRRFHVSEFACFAGLMADYFLATDKPEAAMPYYEVLEKIAPDHDATRRLRPVFGASLLRKLLQRR